VSVNLWFNHNFSSIFNICELLHQGVKSQSFPGSLKIFISHSEPSFVARPMADIFFEDFRTDNPDSYVEWCLDKCRRLAIDVFWPSRGVQYLADSTDEFEKIGTRLMIPASAVNLEILNDKVYFYESLSNNSQNIPRWFKASNFNEFYDAVDLLRQEKKSVCFKPAKSIYGLGFKIIREKMDPFKAFLYSDNVTVSLEEAYMKLNVPDASFTKLLVMECLPGPEFSIDCLSLDGKLIKASIRKKSFKSGCPEKLIKDEELFEIAKFLAQRFNMSWIFNLQVRDSDNGHFILEINPRMAGGLYFSCLAGINYPYWAVRLALEPCEHLIPEQQFDIYVNQVNKPFIYEINN
jgi:biotin carboxylase